MSNMSEVEIKKEAIRLIECHVKAKGWQEPREIILDVLEAYDNAIYPEYETENGMANFLR